MIYLQSDQKGFRKWRTSFKAAVIIAASLASSVLETAEAQGFLGGRDSSETPLSSNIRRQRQSPSNFPAPSLRVRSSRNVPGVNRYCTAPKIVPEVGAAVNPAGAGGGGVNPKFDGDK